MFLYNVDPLDVPAHQAQVVNRYDDSNELLIGSDEVIPVLNRDDKAPHECHERQDCIVLDPGKHEFVQPL